MLSSIITFFSLSDLGLCCTLIEIGRDDSDIKVRSVGAPGFHQLRHQRILRELHEASCTTQATVDVFGLLELETDIFRNITHCTQLRATYCLTHSSFAAIMAACFMCQKATFMRMLATSKTASC